MATIGLCRMNDTWVTWGDPNGNYDAYTALVVRPTGLDNALFKFNRSSLPQNATIITATLTLNVTGQTGAAGKQLTVLNVDPYTPAQAPWAVTYANAPAIYNPGPSVDVPIIPGPLSFDVTDQVDVWDAPGLISYHWGYLALSASGPNGRIILDSMESRLGCSPATLRITYSYTP